MKDSLLHIFFSSAFLFGLILLTPASPFLLNAQTDSVEIAKTYVVNDTIEPISGDIVSFDHANGTYLLSRIAGDESLIGVVVEEPILVLATDDGGIPVVRFGEAFVNVTDANGPISIGDYITSSSIPGKGQKADPSDSLVLGIALEAFSGSQIVDAANTVSGGSVRVLLSIGTREQAETVLLGQTSPSTNTGLTEATVLNVIQYLLAAFIAVGSIYIAFKNFGPNIRNGLVSIGRNPLAKASIQSMIILNAVLIVLISAGGLLVGLAILLLPI